MTYGELLDQLKALPKSELKKDVMVLLTKDGECIKIRYAENTADIDVLGAPEQFMLVE